MALNVTTISIIILSIMTLSMADFVSETSYLFRNLFWDLIIVLSFSQEVLMSPTLIYTFVASSCDSSTLLTKSLRWLSNLKKDSLKYILWRWLTFCVKTDYSKRKWFQMKGVSWILETEREFYWFSPFEEKSKCIQVSFKKKT